MNLSFDSLLNNRRLLIAMAGGMILLYFVPYIWLGEDAHILIHDNLDSVVTHIKIIENNDAFFSGPHTIIKSVFNGVPLATVYPYYDLPLTIFMIFGVYWGYVINKMIASCVGFIGMYLLLQRHILPQSQNQFVNIATSWLFAILPFWSFTSSVSALPLAFYAFLNIRSGDLRISNWLIILLFSIISSLILSGAFLIITFGLIWLHDTYKDKKITLAFPAALLTLVGAYLISHAPIIIATIQGVPSHRKEFNRPLLSLGESIREFWSMFSSGQYHAHSLHTLFLVPVLAAILIIPPSLRKKFTLILLFIVLTSLLYGFKDFHYVQLSLRQIQSRIPLQFDRFHFLHPMLWYVLLAISLSAFVLKYRWGKVIVVGVVFIQFGYIMRNHEIIKNRRLPTFRQFYSQKIFDQVKKVIGIPVENYNVVSIGMHPAIAQYNGFHTLDGYFPSYPLAYKHKFREVIEDELRRSPTQLSHFNNWGSRCYAFSVESRKLLNNHPREIDSLKYNYPAFLRMDGKFILATSRINESINQELKFVDSVANKGAFWSIYIYQVIEKQPGSDKIAR